MKNGRSINEMMDPLISCVMPAHNAQETISIAIESILNQTYANLELVIVDDNSTDRTLGVARQYEAKCKKIRVYSLPFDDFERIGWNGKNINAGWAARNYGIEQSKGKWITFQDADDASLLNRVSVQYEFARKTGAFHICLDWQKYDESHVGKYLDVERIIQIHGEKNLIIASDEIFALARNSKGLIPSWFPWIHHRIPHRYKVHPWLEKLFFRDLDTPYPAAGTCCLFMRDLYPKVKFRPLNERVWPSRRGRGADRDFNLALAELRKRSVAVWLPLYLWRCSRQNPLYSGPEYVPVQK